MESNTRLDEFLSVMIKHCAYSTNGNLRFLLKELFKSIDFRGKSVLEIGGGKGLFCFYAAIKGAKNVINIEPEGDGCTSGVVNKFNTLRDELNINNVEIVNSTFQDYDPRNQKFDIILAYNSINHLNENACIDLKTNANSRVIYKNLFEKVASICNTNAKIIICDCSNKNIFPHLSLINPIDRSIEWHLHQSPNFWSILLQESGFCNPVITWTTFNTLRQFGKLLMGNKYVSYFLVSHFCLKMDKK